MTAPKKTFYAELKKQVEGEGERCLSYFRNYPERYEDIESIFETMVGELERADEVVQRPATFKVLYPGGELEVAKDALREITEGITDLHQDNTIQDLNSLYEVKRALKERVDELERYKTRGVRGH